MRTLTPLRWRRSRPVWRHTPKSRGLAEVSSAVAAGEIDFLLVANLSRLGRDVTDVDAYLRWLEDQFVEVVCADGTIPQTSTEILLTLMKESGISLDRVR